MMRKVKKVLLRKLLNSHNLALGISILLFFVPFFWLEPGFVDFGGDAGRLYFLDPLTSALNLFSDQRPLGTLNYAMIPYEIYLYILKLFVNSPTILIAIDHGIQLSLGFLSIYLIVKDFCILSSRNTNETLRNFAAIFGGIVYIGLVSKVGWLLALQTQNQIFLNPLVFYFLLRYFFSPQYFYVIPILLLTILFSGNFGFSSMPQLISFYPFAILFLIALGIFVYKPSFHWKKVMVLAVLFLGLHSFQIIPMVANVLDRGSHVNATVFSQGSHADIINYFDVIRQEYGKLSVELLQPVNWNGRTVAVFVIPLITFLGFLGKRTKLLAIIGIFFTVTFFLVSANITVFGVRIYRQLFTIPGFSMFRSFYEKWYFVYAFFYALLFALSFYCFFINKRRVFAIIAGSFVITSIVFRIYPFLQGKDVNIIHQQLDTTSIFTIDPDLLDALAYIRHIPDDQKVLTLPLTFPNYQVFFGKEGGVYIGISSVNALGGKKDYAGFWSFGSYHDVFTQALRDGEVTEIMQIFSLLNIRYVFRNSDTRILTQFPRYPYYKFDTSVDIPPINTQASYDDFLRLFPLTTRFEKGFFTVSEFDTSVVRPLFYIPDILYASQAATIRGDSFRSAFGDEDSCKKLYACDMREPNVPEILFSRTSLLTYDISVDIDQRKKPFIIVFSEDFHPSWILSFDNVQPEEGVDHLQINGYANAWIIDPVKANISGKIRGEVYLGFQKYFIIGRAISIFTGISIGVVFVFVLIKKYGRKK